MFCKTTYYLLKDDEFNLLFPLLMIIYSIFVKALYINYPTKLTKCLKKILLIYYKKM